MTIRFRPTEENFPGSNWIFTEIPEGIWIFFEFNDVGKLNNKTITEILNIIKIPSWVDEVMYELKEYIPAVSKNLIAGKLKEKYTKLAIANKGSDGKGIKICFHFVKYGGLNFGAIYKRV